MRSLKEIGLVLFLSIYCFFALLTDSKCAVSPNAEISVLTLKPGGELYSLFGHTAIRLRDAENNSDFIYNFGMFDFDEKHFYVRFTRGNLNYYMLKYEFDYLWYDVVTEQRSLYEQKLNLPDTVKTKLIHYLDSLAMTDYRYQYEFFHDNCATKIADLIDSFTNHTISYNFQNYPPNASYRNLINPYLGDYPLVKIGINLLLGPAADIVAGMRDYMFLPDYILYGVDGAVIHHEEGSVHLAEPPELVYNSYRPLPEAGRKDVLYSFAVFFIILVISFIEILRKNHFKSIDSVLFTITGLVGVFIVFLWFWSYHEELRGNINFLWANPLNLLVVFLPVKKKITKIITKILILSVILFFIAVMAGLQGIPLSIVLLALIIFIRLVLLQFKLRPYSKS
jgi:hypothetical protein